MSVQTAIDLGFEDFVRREGFRWPVTSAPVLETLKEQWAEQSAATPSGLDQVPGAPSPDGDLPDAQPAREAPPSPGQRTRKLAEHARRQAARTPKPTAPGASVSPIVAEALTFPRGRPSPAFQAYPGDWLGSTHVALMKVDERGAYWTLLCHAWNAPDCGLPDDDEQLAVLSGLGERWQSKGCSGQSKGGSQNIRNCFISHAGRLYNERLLREWIKQKRHQQNAREGGFKSGETRRKKSLKKQGDTASKGCSQSKSSLGRTEQANEGVFDLNELKTNISYLISQFPTKTTKTFSFDDATERLYRRHPKKSDKTLAEKMLCEILEAAHDAAALFDEIDRVHAAWCKSERWRKEGGQFAPKLVNWLDDEGWTAMPAEAVSEETVEFYRPPWEEAKS